MEKTGTVYKRNSAGEYSMTKALAIIVCPAPGTHGARKRFSHFRKPMFRSAKDFYAIIGLRPGQGYFS